MWPVLTPSRYYCWKSASSEDWRRAGAGWAGRRAGQVSQSVGNHWHPDWWPLVLSVMMIKPTMPWLPRNGRIWSRPGLCSVSDGFNDTEQIILRSRIWCKFLGWDSHRVSQSEPASLIFLSQSSTQSCSVIDISQCWDHTAPPHPHHHTSPPCSFYDV